MKILPILLIILAFSLSGFAQKTESQLKTEVKEFKNNRRYIVKYDKFTDKTTVVYQGSVLGSTMSYVASGTMIQLHAAYGFRAGDKPYEGYILYFKSSGKNWSFLKDQSLYVLADDKRIEMGDGKRDSDINRGIFGEYRTSEFLGFEMSKEQLAELGNAKNLEIKLGGREFKIKDDDKQAFLNLIKLSDK
jgi:hypothetical protein